MEKGWKYVRRNEQGNGELWLDGVKVGEGYSGHGPGLNNPDKEDVRGVGPIPAGRYAMSDFFDHPHLGPVVCHLVPSPENDMHGRSAFDVHGDNAFVNHSASDGCIILARKLREMLRDEGPREIEVV